MSLRPEISGFHLNRLRSTLGCDDSAVAERAVAHARQIYNADSLQPAVSNTVRDLVTGGRPAPKEEDETLIHAVIALAFFEQEHLETDSNTWNSYFVDWALEEWAVGDSGPVLPPDADAALRERISDLLFDALLGRPLIGESQRSDWTTYGYLTHDEVGELIGYSHRFPGLRVDEHGFGADFFGWLDTIHGAGLDYWFFSQ